MAFQRPADEDTGYASQILQIIYAWEGDVGKGQPLDLSAVDSAAYALKVKNKAASSLCFQFLTAAGNPLLRGAGATAYLGQNMEVTAGKTVDGVDISAHAAATTGIHGATATATANKLLIRDAAGRGKVVAPSVAGDIALKSTVDTHAALTSPHSATANPTASRLIVRDASGRAAVAAPAAADDIARKDTVDTVQTNLNTHKTAALLDHPNNSVDDTKVGNRVPALTRRQGGDATNWSANGTTTYTPTAVRMQVGSINWSGAAAASGNQAVTFPIEFSGYPVVLATSRDLTPIAVSAASITVAGCSLRWQTVDGTTKTNVVIMWQAIGPE